MTGVRQIYEKLPATIRVPQALQTRRVEVIILMLDEVQELSAVKNDDMSEPDVEALEFVGCLPDFPERDL